MLPFKWNPLAELLNETIVILVFYKKKFQSFVIFFSLATIKSENVDLVWDLMILFLDYALSSGEIDSDHRLFAYQ